MAARGAAAVRLARRLLRGPEPLASCRLVAGARLLVVLGPAEVLPWVEGAVYLGRDDLAPSLLLPTNVMPDVPLPLVERALLRRVPGADRPVAVLRGPEVLVSTGRAQPAPPAALEEWVARQTA
jgi:hypothetical protein